MAGHFGIRDFDPRLRQCRHEMKDHDDQQHEPVHRSSSSSDHTEWVIT